MVPNETKPFSDLENQKTEYSNEGFSRKPRTKEADFEAEKKNLSNFAFMCYGSFPNRSGLKSTIATHKSNKVKGMTLLLPC